MSVPESLVVSLPRPSERRSSRSVLIKPPQTLDHDRSRSAIRSRILRRPANAAGLGDPEVMADKVQLSAGGDVGLAPPRPQARPWYPDERDALISWLRGEFAAANSIIDALLNHMRDTGEPWEYETVASAVQQRRVSWLPVLHLRQFFPVAEVVCAVQQVTWRKQEQQQRRQFDGGARGERDGRSALPYEYRPVQRAEGFTDNYRRRSAPASIIADDEGTGGEGFRDNHRRRSAPATIIAGGEGRGDSELNEEARVPEEKESVAAAEMDGFVDMPNSQKYCGVKHADRQIGVESAELEPSGAEESLNVRLRDNSNGSFPEDGEATIFRQNGKQEIVPIPKVFIVNEISDGRMVNAVEGLKLYEELFDSSEIKRLLLMANDMKAVGHRGELQGQTLIISRWPSRGHGRESIQLGMHVTNGLPKDGNNGNCGQSKVEAIPSTLQDIFDRLVQLKVLTIKPDFCIIDFFNEADYSHPHVWPHWFGRFVCTLFLTECDMVFGRTIAMDRRGDHKGSLKLSFKSGALLVTQDRSREQAKHAITSLSKQRILVTFGKSQPKWNFPSDGQHFSSSPMSPPSSCDQSSIRSPVAARQSSCLKHYAVSPSTGVLQAPSIHSQRMLPPNGTQPLFIAPAGLAPISVPYPTPIPISPSSAGWTLAIAAPRLPVPGTGVFLPPRGAGRSPKSQQLQGAAISAECRSPSETTCQPGKESVEVEKSNGSSDDSPKVRTEGAGPRPECNGNSVAGSGVGPTKEDHQNASDRKNVTDRSVDNDAK